MARGTRSTGTREEREDEILALLRANGLDGLHGLSLADIRAMERDEIARLTGFAAIADIPQTTGAKGGNGGPYFLRRASPRKAGRTAMWIVVARTGRGRRPELLSTGLPADRPFADAQAAAVPAIAKHRGETRLPEKLSRETVAGLGTPRILDLYEEIFLAGVDDEAGGQGRENQRYALKRLRRTFNGYSLYRLSTAKLTKTYDTHARKKDGKRYSPATRKFDLDLLISSTNEVLRRLHWSEFALEEKIPRGPARRKPNLSREDLIRIFLALAGLRWDADEDCWRTEVDPATGAIVFAVAPPRRLAALEPLFEAVFVALFTVSRKSVVLEAGVDDRRAPHRDGSQFHRGGLDHVETAKLRLSTMIGPSFARVYDRFEEAARAAGATTVVHKSDGTRYRDVNRMVWYNVLDMLGIERFPFHSLKAVAVDILKSAGLSLIEISEYTATSIETLQRHYRCDDSVAVQWRPMAALDALVAGGAVPPEPSVAPPAPSATSNVVPLRTPSDETHAPKTIEGAYDLLRRVRSGERIVARGEPATPARAPDRPDPADAAPPKPIAIADARHRLRPSAEDEPTVETPAPPTRAGSPTPASGPGATADSEGPQPADAAPGPVARSPLRLSATTLAPRGGLSDDEWSALAPLLCAEAGDGLRPTPSLRRAVDGMLHIAVTGIAWRGLPRRYGHPDIARKAFAAWTKRGVLDRVRAQLVKFAAMDAGVAGALLEAIDGIAGMSNRPSPTTRRAPVDLAAEPEALTDAEWTVCLAAIGRDTPGRRRRLDALLWVAETRRSWRQLPPRLGDSDAARYLLDVLAKSGRLERLAQEAAARAAAPDGRPFGPLAARLRNLADFDAARPARIAEAG